MESSVKSIKYAISALESKDLIEDYFEVNSSELSFTGNAAETLVPEFCVDKWTVLEFSLTGTLASADNDFSVQLLINDTAVAETTVDDDNDSPTHFSLLYRGGITTACGVEVQITSNSAATVPAMGLQWGYRIYKKGYPLITSPDTTSCSLI